MVRICYLLDFGPFQVIFEGARQFWASVAKGVGGREVRVGMGWEVATACEKLSREAPQ